MLQTATVLERESTRGQARVLVVDDERAIRTTLSALLKQTYEVATAPTGVQALQILSEHRYDLVLLDIHLPDLCGVELLGRIKQRYPEVTVIMLTGHASVENAIAALRQGAVDYLRKPITWGRVLRSVREGLQKSEQYRQRNLLLLRAKELFETGLEELAEVVPEEAPSPTRSPPAPRKGQEPARYLRAGPLQVDTYRHTATLRGAELELTAGEYDLLLCLLRHAPRVLDPRKIVEETRGFECTLSEARDLIRWQIYLLRQKLEPDPAHPQFILNVRGKGYMWAGG
ncbi:MAG: response regulator transcription factor [Anaerolineales bacterium]